MAEQDPPHIGVATRLWFAFVCFFRVLFDAVFADHAWEAAHGVPALPPSPTSEKPFVKPPEKPSAKRGEDPSALQLLALLQREGRFVDFLEEDVTAFSDVEVGAAARVVHDGCRKALHDHASVKPVRAEEEGATVTVDEGTSPSAVKLTGLVGGRAPFSGVLRHRGWRVEDLRLPTAMEGHDPGYVAPAEVEL